MTYERTTTNASECAINRYYTPQTGNFLSVDPTVATTTAPYVYATSDPVNEVDPDGLYELRVLLYAAGVTWPRPIRARRITTSRPH